MLALSKLMYHFNIAPVDYLGKVNQQTLIIGVGRHSPYIHHQVRTGESVAFVLLKLQDLELSRHFDIQDQTQLIYILPK